MYVDDATSRLMHLHFTAIESTFGYFEATRAYIDRHGKLVALYSDRASMFRNANGARRASPSTRGTWQAESLHLGECRSALHEAAAKRGHNESTSIRLLLSANLDAFFDKELITFVDGGGMQISPRLEARHIEARGLPKSLRFVPDGTEAYLKYHRERAFQR